MEGVRDTSNLSGRTYGLGMGSFKKRLAAARSKVKGKKKKK
jgi:hypothetical protein